MSTRIHAHLDEHDRAWFITDSFRWLVDQDRGEIMQAQNPTCAMRANARSLPESVKVHEFLLPDAPPGNYGMKPPAERQPELPFRAQTALRLARRLPVALRYRLGAARPLGMPSRSLPCPSRHGARSPAGAPATERLYALPQRARRPLFASWRRQGQAPAQTAPMTCAAPARRAASTRA